MNEFEDFVKDASIVHYDTEIRIALEQIMKLNSEELNDETKDDDFLVEQERINREFLSKLEIENFSKKIGTQILQSSTTDGKLDFDKLEKSYAESNKIENVQKFFQDVDNIAQKSIVLNPKNIFAYRLRATIPNGENFKNINQAVILAPENSKVYIERGELYQILKKDYARAEKDFNKAVELDLKNIESYEKRADFYTKIEKYPQAIEDYTKILQLNPNDIDALRQRAEIYSKLQNYNKAVEDYSKLIYSQIIKSNPKNVSAYKGRGDCYFLRTDYKDYNELLENKKNCCSRLFEGYKIRSKKFICLRKIGKLLSDFAR